MGPTVVTSMWRGVDVFRPIAWLYAVYSAFVRQEDFARPWLGWIVLGTLGCWTAGMLLYRTRTTTVVGLELLLACAAIFSTRLVDTSDVIAGGAKTLPGFWPAAAVLAWAVLKGWRGGMLAAAFVGAADILEVGVATENTVTNIVILILLGGCIGYCADLSREGHAALREALRLQAEVRERDRLARTVHDGVLQTLSYIHRRGLDLGGESGDLGLMAADQERLLRALVSVAPPQDALACGEVDLRLLLRDYAQGHVNVIPPAEPVLLARGVADEVSAAVSAALDNVSRHAGADAHAWVLIEDDGHDVTVTIRDNGVGVSSDRLAEAAAGGRLGVATSIRRRMSDLGGTAVIESRPGAGTSLELVVPKKERLS
ncbi:MAG: DUF5931 domain-containing protein [Dermatophilaceae bacterium]